MDETDETLERMAAQAHKSWSGWMEYLFKMSARNADGTVTIPGNLVERWERQIATTYADLTEPEKQSDRVEAQRMRDAYGPSPAYAALEIIREVHGRYPEDVFPEPEPGEHGETVDACSARASRGALKAAYNEVCKRMGLHPELRAGGTNA